jgi:hypothetical protein
MSRRIPQVRGDTVPTVVQQQTIPDRIRSLSNLARIDYGDLFTATRNTANTSAEQLARAIVEGAPHELSRRFLWRAVLGLRLEPHHSPGCMGGWKIGGRGDSWLRIEAASWFITAHVVFHVDDDHLSAATFIRYDRPVAAVLMPPVTLMHRCAMPGLLRYAVNALT